MSVFTYRVSSFMSFEDHPGESIAYDHTDYLNLSEAIAHLRLLVGDRHVWEALERSMWGTPYWLRPSCKFGFLVVRLGTCAVCSEFAEWVDCPTGGWWSHLKHPEDDHDAEVV